MFKFLRKFRKLKKLGNTGLYVHVIEFRVRVKVHTGTGHELFARMKTSEKWFLIIRLG